MTQLVATVGPIDLDMLEGGFALPMRQTPQDWPKSIRLAQAALRSTDDANQGDRSLVWTRDGTPVAFAPIFLRGVYDGLIELQGMPHPLRLPTVLSPLSNNEQRSILATFQAHMGTTLSETTQGSASVWVPANLSYTKSSIEGQWITQTPTISAAIGLEITLGTDEHSYWTDLRRSYRSLINKGMRDLKVHVFTGEAETGVDIFERLHAAAAGRSVYNEQFWQVINEQVLSGQASCIVVSLGSRPIGAALFLLEGQQSSYAMGAFDRTLMRQGSPIGHTALWVATRWLRDHGFASLSMGVSISPSPSSGKASGIEQFKRGFANTLTPWLVTELRLENSQRT